MSDEWPRDDDGLLAELSSGDLPSARPASGWDAAFPGTGSDAPPPASPDDEDGAPAPVQSAESEWRPVGAGAIADPETLSAADAAASHPEEGASLTASSFFAYYTAHLGADPSAAAAPPTADGTPGRCCCPLCTGQLAYADSGDMGSGPQAIVPAQDPNYIQALLSGSSWASQGSAVTLTYSFLTSAPAYWSGYEDSDTFSAFNETQKAAARNALAEWSDVARITFQEVSGTGQIAFSNNVQSGSAGYAYYPSQWHQIGGDVFIASNYSYNLNPTETNYGYLVLEHEIGHAIGLKHPGNYGNGDPPYLDSAHDTNQYSVMSYYRHAGSGMSSVYPISAMLYDIAAIQYLYGANYQTRSGDTSYSWSNNQRFLETIWDGGGNDTIDGSNQTAAVRIDLRPGAFSTIGSANTDNLAIALANTGSNLIENAKGGSAADTLDGNDGANRLDGNGGNDTLNGGLGNDTLVGGSGNDRLDGGTGNDTAVYSGAAASYQVNIGADFTTVVQAGGDGADTLYGIEYLQFSDQTETIGGGSGGGAGTVSVSGGSVSEGNSGSSPVHFTVTLSSAAASNTVVTYATASGSAQAGTDFQSGGGSVTIPAGATSATIDVAVYGDQIAEGDETFTLTLTGVSGGGGATLGTPATATGTILDNDQAVVTVGAASATEGAAGNGGQLIFPVSLSTAAATATTVTYRTIDGSAHAGEDFTGKTGATVVIPAGSTSASIAIAITGDSLYEGQEQLTLELTQASGGNGAVLGSARTALGTIIDDDSVLVTIGDAQVTEGTGSQAALLVSLSAARSAATTVTYRTVDGTANGGSDYQSVANGTLTIPAGAVSATLLIPLLADSVVEPSERFNVVLSAVSGGSGVALGNDSVGEVTLVDDDQAALSLVGGSILEANSGQGTALFTVNLSAPSASDTVVFYRTSDGTARAGNDYVAATQGQLTIPAGAITAGLGVSVLGDGLVEGNETFSVTLTGSNNAAIGLAGGGSTASFTIIDDDQASVTIAGTTVVEGNTGSHSASLAISLSRAATTPTIVGYRTVAGSAAAGTDFTATTGQVTIAAGATSATLEVGILGDRVVEGDESFTVELVSVQGNAGITLGNAVSATVTIDDDDSAAIRIEPVTVDEGDDGSTTASFRVTLSAAAAAATVVHYHTVDGSAAAGEDYAGVANGAVTIPAGATVATVAIALQGDDLIEGDETFAVVLTGLDGATGISLGTPATATGTIVNDDAGTEPPADGLNLADGAGGPLVVGSTADDHVSAGSGSDTLVGGAGSDLLDGGDGADLLFGDLVGTGDDSVRGGGDADTIYGGSGKDTLAGGTGNDLLLGEQGNDTLIGDEGNDVLFGGAGADYLRGGDGNDTLFGDEGRNSLDGGAGDDRIYADGEDAFATGGTGNDMLVIQGDGLSAIDLAAELNQNTGGGGPVLQGFEAVDASLATVAMALAGNDLGNLLIGGSLRDTILGGAGSDTLIGSGGADQVDGGDGGDRLIWTGGNDTLTGGGGSDTFELVHGTQGDRPRITDFAAVDDTIALDADYGLTAATALGRLSQHGADTWLALPDGATVILVGITSTSLTVADFQIV